MSTSGARSEVLGAARLGAAAFAYDRDALQVTGRDAVTFLHGQVSADVTALGVGESTWSLLLGPRGKLDAWVRLTRTDDDEVLVDVDAGWGEATLARLRRFLLRVDVSLRTVQFGWLALRGPRSGDLAAVLAGARGANRAVAVDWRGLAGVDIAVPVGSVVDTGGSVEVHDGDLLEVLRVEQGWPAMGHELTGATIPAEIGRWFVDASVSFTKGCYTGQELVARIDSRGSETPRRLLGLRFDAASVETSAPPVPGSSVVVDGERRGEVTSIVDSSVVGTEVALCLLYRSVAVGDVVEVDGVPADVVELPFVR